MFFLSRRREAAKKSKRIEPPAGKEYGVQYVRNVGILSCESRLMMRESREETL